VRTSIGGSDRPAPVGGGSPAKERGGTSLGIDVGLYAASALFAWATAGLSTLAPHRAWGEVAVVGYAVAAAAALTQLTAWWLATRTGGTRPNAVESTHAPRPATWLRWVSGAGARAGVAIAAWVAVALLPLLLQSLERAGGRTDRAQEEVIVVEDGGRRLLESGSPYLDRAAVAALPESERLLGYLPYQPAMAVFGLPRALDGSSAWWSDARVWFAALTAMALAGALLVLRHPRSTALVRGLQVATVLPVCALTLATGGDDLPVLALCLLAFALAATDRLGAAGVAIGAAASLKLFAWPVAIVLGVYAMTRAGTTADRSQSPTRAHRGRPSTRASRARFMAAALGLPLLSAAPALLIDPGALIENVFAFPLGRGIVTSPAASPLPGHLIATSLPGGRTIAIGLLIAAGLTIAVWLVRKPPPTAAAASLVCAAGLATAMLLLPATRFGYLLYPIAFLIWTATLRPAGRPVLTG
jgi:hypothetical protein